MRKLNKEEMLASAKDAFKFNNSFHRKAEELIFAPDGTPFQIKDREKAVKYVEKKGGKAEQLITLKRATVEAGKLTDSTPEPDAPTGNDPAAEELFKKGVEAGVITRHSSWYKVGDRALAQKEAESIAEIAEDKELQSEISAKITETTKAGE